MKLADEMRNISRRPTDRLYYENLIEEIKREAHEGGTYKITLLATTFYNKITKRLLTDGFRVFIYNYSPDNPSHMTYIVWDYDKFAKSMEDNTEMSLSDFREGLL